MTAVYPIGQRIVFFDATRTRPPVVIHYLARGVDLFELVADR